MKQTVLWTLGVVVGVIAVIAFVGFIKFGILADDIYVTNQHGEVVQYNALQKQIERGEHPAEWKVPAGSEGLAESADSN